MIGLLNIKISDQGVQTRGFKNGQGASFFMRDIA